MPQVELKIEIENNQTFYIFPNGDKCRFDGLQSVYLNSQGQQNTVLYMEKIENA